MKEARMTRIAFAVRINPELCGRLWAKVANA